MDNVGSWSFEHKLEESLRRTLPKLAPEARAALAAAGMMTGSIFNMCFSSR